MKRKMFLFGFLILFMQVFSTCSDNKFERKGSDDVTDDHVAGTDDSADTLKAIRRNRAIGKGMNIGNALEAPEEGAWGLVVKESYIEAIAEAGFNSVRFPICWSAHTEFTPPYTIDPGFIARVDEILGWCFDRDLAVVITIHHFNELYNEPMDETYRQVFFSIWDQLSKHYSEKYPEKLIFELLNEPHNNLTAGMWNELLPEILEVVRAADTIRTLIIDVPDWAYHESIGKLEIPEEEKNVIVSVRYYIPYDFTHQGAHWVENSDEWMGLTWTGTSQEKQSVITHMEAIADWAETHNRPVTIGEYGAIINAAHEHRVRWTEFVRSQFEAFGFSWSYFDFGMLFRAYDIENNAWLEGFPDVFFDE